jgi:hypothetical protein
MTLIQAQLKQRIGTLAFDHYAQRNTLGAAPTTSRSRSPEP